MIKQSSSGLIPVMLLIVRDFGDRGAMLKLTRYSSLNWRIFRCKTCWIETGEHDMFVNSYSRRIGLCYYTS